MQRMAEKIKKILRSGFLFLLYFSGIVALRFWFIGRRSGPRVRIITYHQVKKHQIEKFDKNLAMLSRQCNVLTPEAFANSNFSQTKLNILITFDDGYASWMTNVLPYMEKHQLKGIYFIPSGYIDAGENGTDFYATKRLSIKSVAPLSWEDVKKIAQKDVIGGHTISHPILGLIDMHAQKFEIGEDKKRIEEKIKTKLEYFAYPFGDKARVPSRCYSVPQELGYKFAFTTIPGFYTQTDSPFSINRDCLEPDFSPLITKAWIYGGYDIFRFFKRVIVF